MNQKDIETAMEDLASNSLVETRDTNLNYHRSSGSSKRNDKSSSKRPSRRSSSGRHHSDNGPSTRPSYKKSSSEVVSSSTKRQRSRIQRSNGRPSQQYSTDSTKTIKATGSWTETGGIETFEEKVSRARGRRRSGNGGHSDQQSTSRSPLHTSRRDSAVLETLYGTEEEWQEKKKTQRTSSKRATEPGFEHISSTRSSAIKKLYRGAEEAKEKGRSRGPNWGSKPGVEHVSNHSGLAINTLYGGDSDAKTKLKSSRESSVSATVPGVEHVSKHSSLGITTLYGDDSDAKAKAKASRESSERATTPGVDQVPNPSARTNKSTVSKLYGSDEDTKLKMKASRESSVRTSLPVVGQVPNSSARTSKSTVSKLYGSDEDAKLKAKASGRSSEMNSIPVDNVCINNSVHTLISTLYGSVADSKAKARASTGVSQFARTPGAESMHNLSTTSTLYGGGPDAKAKRRSLRVSATFAANQGVERVEGLTTSSGTESISGNSSGDGENEVEEPVARRVSIRSTHSDSLSRSAHSEPKPTTDSRGVRAEARDALRMPNDPEYGKSRKRAKGIPRKSRKRQVATFFLLFLLIGGGVAAWYFLFRNDDFSSKDNPTNTPDIQNPTTTPSSPTAMTLAPDVQLDAENITQVPAAPPSIKFLYEPPSESDCIAISLNQTIAGREEMDSVEFGLELEVVLVENTTMTKQLVEKLLDAIQEKILPSLASCSIFSDDELAAWRFVIFDAFVKGNAEPEKECTDAKLVSLNCHRIFVELDIFLKGTMKFLDIYRMISNEQENFSENLGLSESFEVVKMISFNSLTTTAAPTTIQSNVPSLAPTEFPTLQASVNPTSPPTVAPTMSVSGQPTILPTTMPTSESSGAPTTALPSSNPSVAPSEAPSNKPSSGPSQMFSGTPTSLLSEAPSARPTQTPSKTPSHSPSGEPSPSPTVVQSISPTVKSSGNPSSAPSMSPSSPPTRVPSEQPSVSPSILLPTTVYVPVGMNKKCPFGHPDRLFKINSVADVDECYNACLSTDGCVVFSVGMFGGTLNCMGCTTTDTMQNHNGFTAYLISG